ncbi:MAG: AraC family transcriptional regulator, partial [Verrucomicrobiota bacterium]
MKTAKVLPPLLRLPSLEWEESTGRHAVRFSTGGSVRFDRSPTNLRHRHDYWEICLVLSGAGVYHHGDRSHALEPGDLFLADPGVTHEITSYKTRDLALVFFNARILGTPSPLGERAEDGWVARFLEGHAVHAARCQRLEAYLHWFRPGQMRGALGEAIARQQMRLLVYEMLAALTTSTGRGRKRSQPSRPDQLELALRHISAHVGDPLRAADVATAVHASERTLRRLFRRHLGRGVLELIHERKLAYACQQLLMRFPVSEVAERCAMDSPAHFSRLFKQRFGISPKEYQLRHSPRATQMQTRQAEPAAKTAE